MSDGSSSSLAFTGSTSSAGAESFHGEEQCITLVRTCYDVFAKLQSSRFAADVDATATQGRGAGMGSQQHQASERLRRAGADIMTLARWSQCYTQVLVSMCGKTTALLWDLATLVISLHEASNPQSTNAARPFVDWFRQHFVVQDTLTGEKLHVDVTTPLAEYMADIAGKLYAQVQQCVFSGLFSNAAEILSMIVEYLRAQSCSVFTAEEESAMADVIRVLQSSWDTKERFYAWRERANVIILHVRHVLDARREVMLDEWESASVGGNDGPHTDSALLEEAVTQVKRLCFDLLLVISGDGVRLREMCCDIDSGLVTFMAGFCAAIEPFATVVELGNLFVLARDGDEAMGLGHVDAFAAEANPWYVSVIGSLLVADGLHGILAAMVTLNDELDGREHGDTCWNAEHNGSAPPSPSSYGAGERDAFEGASVPLLGLRAMAAHVADLCAPAFVAPVDHVSLTFQRNMLIERYIRAFQQHPALWKIAALYRIFSPLSDPRLLRDALVSHLSRLQVEGVEGYDGLLSLNGFISQYWDEASVLQQRQRQELRARVPGSATLESWIRALDEQRRDATQAITQMAITKWVNSGEIVSALWLALQTQVTEDLQLRLRRLLSSSGALQAEEVVRIGEAVLNGFIPGAGPSTSAAGLGGMLQLCASLSEVIKLHALLVPSLDLRHTGGAVPSLPGVGTERHHGETNGDHCSDGARRNEGAAFLSDDVLAARAMCLEQISRSLMLSLTEKLHPSVTLHLVEFGAKLLLLGEPLPVAGDHAIPGTPSEWMLSSAASAPRGSSVRQHRLGHTYLTDGRVATGPRDRGCGQGLLDRSTVLLALSHALELLSVSSTGTCAAAASNYSMNQSRVAQARIALARCVVLGEPR